MAKRTRGAPSFAQTERRDGLHRAQVFHEDSGDGQQRSRIRSRGPARRLHKLNASKILAFASTCADLANRSGPSTASEKPSLRLTEPEGHLYGITEE